MKHKVIGLRFHVPFRLALGDNLFKVNLKASQLCLITTQSRLGRLEFSTQEALAENIPWGEGGASLAALNLELKSGEILKAVEARLDNQDKALIIRTPLGYTTIEVILEIPKGKTRDEYTNEGVNHANEILQKFLLGYRLYTAHHQIPDLRPHEIPVVEIRYGTATELEPGRYHADLNSGNRLRLLYDDPQKHATIQFPATKIAQVGEWASCGMPIPESARISLIATERLFIYEDYPSAVIFSETSFEVYLSYFLRTRAAKAGISELTLKNGTKKSLDEALRERTTDAMKLFVPEVTGHNVAGGTEYNNWYHDTYLIRHQIVHQGKLDVTRQQAIRAYESAGALINYLQKQP